ncbi:MAG TPA: GAF domain-containing protein [Solirubrobacteraceae bacterium]|nr:GAF domain-containing protein [Solirubrobacteraceae bacterium]
MPNQWLAIDAATAPVARAREVRRAWETFVGGGATGLARSASAPLRDPIVASWRRSAAAGVDPSGGRMAPVVADADEASARWEIHPLAEMAPLIRACLAATADESQHLIVVSDANGVLLWLEGHARVRLRAADSMNFAEGTLWSEGGAGTNAIGTALAADHAVQVFAAEHFNEVVQEWTCAAAPVHDPETGQVIGVIDLTGEMTTVHPHSMAVAVATARAVEAHLRCEMLGRDARLLARYGDRLAGPEPRALLSRSGRVIASQPLGWLPGERLAVPSDGGAVSIAAGITAVAEPLGAEAFLLCVQPEPEPSGHLPAHLSLALLGADRPTATVELGEGVARQVQLRLRHAEILTLLCANPGGLSSEQLSEGLYGDPLRTGSIRVEISRLRKLLGDCLQNDHYRLRSGVSSDVAQVAGLLHRGQVREAAARYRGPLLPSSKAPGVVREREELEGWLRQSVMRAGDVAALWEWVQGHTGAGDLAAWQRLLANLPFQDPRRPLAAAHVARLRAHEAERSQP